MSCDLNVWVYELGIMYIIALMTKERQRKYHKRKPGDYDVAKALENGFISPLDCEEIPQIRPWLERSHREVGFFLPQFLSGNGYFKYSL